MQTIPVSFSGEEFTPQINQLDRQLERKLSALGAILTQTPVAVCTECNRMVPGHTERPCPLCGRLQMLADITPEYITSICNNYCVTPSALHLTPFNQPT